ncbi:MAG: T9SS type B sorting domain-containing protein [Bacteroidia bacterium]
MKKILFVLTSFLFISNNYGQSDNCSAAPVLAITASCSSPVAGTSAGATQSFAGCVGTADDDVWYQFVAAATSVSIQVTPSGGYDAVVEIFSGSCSSPVSIACVDNALSGGIENLSVSGLTAGNTYYMRIYHYFAGSGTSTFTTCITNSPPAPANNTCGGAVNLTVNGTCIGTAGNSYGATQSYAGCTGTADDDVWYSFTANNYTQTIQVTSSANMDAVVELFSGPCGSLSSLNCVDNTFSGGVETINAVGLSPGTVYYIRVYDYYAAGGYPFTICVSGNPIGAGQPNDNPCTAIQLPAVTSDCNYLQFSTVGATQTSTLLAPAPASCAGGSPPAMGGFTTTTKDVWFKITVPANGKLYITPEPNLGAGYITDGAMAIYSGACNALTQIACSDDYSAYPGSSNDLLPYLAVTGQTPGATLYLRYWAYGTSSGTFGICVQSPTNDNCSSSLYICDLNGYSGSTSAAYTVDRPCNMRGNAEMAGTYSYTPGTNQGGIFGQGGSWGAGSPAYDVQINNNSWIKFTAAASSAVFNINIGNCWVGNYPSGGIQMQIFSAASACCNFTPVSNFKEGSSTFTIGANGLTVGNNYYLMIDGYAGDICNYSINALTGVSFGNIVASPDSICPGGSSILTGPNGATSYSWMPGGVTTQTLLVNPGSTITYTCIASGVCGLKQTITKKIVVKQLPTVQINSGAAITTCGTQTITLTGSGANSYTWSTGANTGSISVAPSANTTYTLKGKTNGCTNTVVTTVTVNPLPSISGTPSVSPAGCSVNNGSITSVNITGSAPLSYTWTNSSNTIVGNSPNLLNQFAGTYNLLVKDGKGCTKTFGPYSIINPGAPGSPTVSATATTLCVGATINLFASSSTGGATYTWSGPNSFSSSQQNPTLTAASINNSGIYSVFATASNCSGPATTLAITVNNNPAPTASSSQTSYCAGNTVTLSSSPASSYSWTGPGGFTSSSQTPVITPAAPGNSGTYQLSVTDANGCSGATSISVTVNSNPSVTASAASTVLCAGDTMSLSATGGDSYSWTGPNGFTSAQQNPVIISTPLSTGLYSLVATNTITGCNSNTVVNVQVNSLPNFTAAAASGSFCTNSSIQLTAGGNNITTYNWSGPSSYTATGSVQTINNAGSANAGNYSVTVTDVNGCQSSQTIPVFVYSLTPVSASVSSAFGVLCSGSSLSLTAGNGATSYTWNGPGNYSSTQQNPVITNPQTSASGIYSLTLTDANGCTNSNTVNVNINSTPTVVNTTNGLSCSGQSLTLSANFGIGAIINWYSDPAASNTVAVNSSTYSPALSSSGTYTYYVVGTINGCPSPAVPVVANFYNVVANYSASPLSGGAPLNVQFTNQSLGITSTDINYWTFGDGNTSSVYDPSNTFVTPGTYTTVLIVSNGLCSDTTIGTIQVNPTTIEVPEVLTPNGDGKNDVFDIKNIEYYPDNELLIFNRWGNTVYSMKSYKNEWNGSPNVSGKTGTGKLPPGTYFYLLKLNDGENHVFRGFCELLY